MADPFLEREKELKKLNESLNTKMIFDLKHPKVSAASNRMRKSAAKSFKCDQINHAKLCTKGTSKLKADSCEITKKPISNAYTTAAAATTAVEKFTVVEKKHELDMKDIGFNRKSSNTNSCSSHSNNADDMQTTCNEGIKQTTMGDGSRSGGSRGDDDVNKQQINNENFDHALIETVEKAIDTKVVSSTTTVAHLSLIPANVYRKNISTDGIIK